MQKTKPTETKQRTSKLYADTELGQLVAYLNGKTILLEAQDLDKDDRAEWKKEESA